MGSGEEKPRGRRLGRDDVFVVNPSLGNGVAGEALRSRLTGIFPGGYNTDFRCFSDIEAILDRVGRGRRAASP